MGNKSGFGWEDMPWTDGKVPKVGTLWENKCGKPRKRKEKVADKPVKEQKDPKKPKYNITREYFEEAAKTRSIKEMALDCGCHRDTIRHYSKKYNIKPKRGLMYPQLENGDWLKNELSTKTQKKVAQEVGCNESLIVKYVIKHGIQKRKGKENA